MNKTAGAKHSRGGTCWIRLHLTGEMLASREAALAKVQEASGKLARASKADTDLHALQVGYQMIASGQDGQAAA